MKFCRVCGKPFEPKKATRQMYCSLECAAEKNRTEARERQKKLRWIEKKLREYRA